jgi:hypothetical protein
MAISEDVVDEEAKFSPMEELPQEYDPTPPYDPPEVEPLISMHTLVGFCIPQTLKLTSYIKHRKFIILIDCGNTHNFIHRRIVEESIVISV